MRILLSSYSMGAGRGSEAGVGWNIASGLARRGHEIAVLTTEEFGESNKQAIREQQLGIELLEWSCGLQNFHLRESYHAWQRLIRPQVRALLARRQFDILHHVTFNQYRGITFAYEAGLPYLIGPIGGAETVPFPLLGELRGKPLLKEIARYIGADAIPSGWRRYRGQNNGIVLASNEPTARRLRTWGLMPNVEICPTIAIHAHEIVDWPQRHPDTPPYFTFDGGARPEKGAHLLFRALSLLWQQGRRIPVRLAGVKEPDKPGLLAAAQRAGLPDEAVDLMPFIPRHELLDIMQQSAAFVSAGFRDSGGMAILEAVALGIPVVCYDIPSQQWLPTEFADKIPVRSGQLEQDLAAALLRAADAPARTAEWHANRCAFLRRHMTWDTRLDQIETYYNRILNTSSQP